MANAEKINAEFGKRIESESKAATTIRNEDMVCKDCGFRIDGNGSQCKIYEVTKPNNVVFGKDCEAYIKEAE